MDEDYSGDVIPEDIVAQRTIAFAKLALVLNEVGNKQAREVVLKMMEKVIDTITVKKGEVVELSVVNGGKK